MAKLVKNTKHSWEVKEIHVNYVAEDGNNLVFSLHKVVFKNIFNPLQQATAEPYEATFTFHFNTDELSLNKEDLKEFNKDIPFHAFFLNSQLMFHDVNDLIKNDNKIVEHFEKVVKSIKQYFQKNKATSLIDANTLKYLESILAFDKKNVQLASNEYEDEDIEVFYNSRYQNSEMLGLYLFSFDSSQVVTLGNLTEVFKRKLTAIVKDIVFDFYNDFVFVGGKADVETEYNRYLNNVNMKYNHLINSRPSSLSSSQKMSDITQSMMTESYEESQENKSDSKNESKKESNDREEEEKSNDREEEEKSNDREEEEKSNISSKKATSSASPSDKSNNSSQTSNSSANIVPFNIPNVHEIESQNSYIAKNIPEDEDITSYLKNMIEDKTTRLYDGQCIRKATNFSKLSKEFNFDNILFNKELLREEIPLRAPKLKKLIENIHELDKRDMQKYGKLFKHFIFSEIKSRQGARMLTSALLAYGYNMANEAKLKKGVHPSTSSKSGSKSVNTSYSSSSPSASSVEEDEGIESGSDGSQEGGKSQENMIYTKPIQIKSDEELLRTKNNNFFLLSSVDIFEQSLSSKLKKAILAKFNQRPENIQGELARFIIMDSGFKEGIDLFDIKYIHIYEPQTTTADQKQVIGRGTRTCGQKGLVFHPKKGWPLYVFNYDIGFDNKFKNTFLNTKTAIELYLKSMNIDIRIVNFTSDIEKLMIFGSVDYELNKAIHQFSIQGDAPDSDIIDFNEKMSAGSSKKSSSTASQDSDDRFTLSEDDKNMGARKSPNVHLSESPMLSINGSDIPTNSPFWEMRNFIHENFSQYSWEDVKLKDECNPPSKGGCGGPSLNDILKGGEIPLLTYTPTQDFIHNYFVPSNPIKGMLLNHSVGTGKTCTAIATATDRFEEEGYTILWVTRTTLKNDIWKNMFDQICNERFRRMIRNGQLTEIPKDQNKRFELLSDSWNIRPISYKQFSNLILKRNIYYSKLVKKNGEVDPLRKTLLVIDEAHKLYGGNDLSSVEKPDMNALHRALMNSYEVSGSDSVKLILMTATPITQSPMELVQLINLCKPIGQQMPDNFDSFSQQYLNNNGFFSKKGRIEFLNNIAGHISYLNREKDARQFSQPIIQNVVVPIADGNVNEMIKKLDKQHIKAFYEENISSIEGRLLQQKQNFEHFKADIKKKIKKDSFTFLKEKCDDAFMDDKKKKTLCMKFVTMKTKEVMAIIKEQEDIIKRELKKLQSEIKEVRYDEKKNISEAKEQLKAKSDFYEDFQKSLYYVLKNKCGKELKDLSQIEHFVKNNEVIVQIENEKKAIEDEINRLTKYISLYRKTYQLNVKEIKNALSRSNLSGEDKRSLTKQLSKINADKTKEITKTNSKMKVLKQGYKKAVATRKKFALKLRKSLKKHLRTEFKAKALREKELKKAHQGILNLKDDLADLKNDVIKGKIKEVEKEVDEKIEHLTDKTLTPTSAEVRRMEAQAAKIAKQEAKLAEKENKLRVKQAEKEAKEAEKAAKDAAKEAEKAAKDAAKEAEKAAKEAAKKAQQEAKERQRGTQKAMKEAAKAAKAANKTMKVRKPVDEANDNMSRVAKQKLLREREAENERRINMLKKKYSSPNV